MGQFRQRLRIPWETVGLAALFGAMYFVQGIGEPSDGLITQPVQSILKGWHYSVDDIALFMMLMSIPWWFKPVFGLLSDFVPLWGSHRRVYLQIASGLTCVGFAALYVFPPEPGAYWQLLGMLLLATVGVAFSDVVVDALMIEKGQPRGLTGRLQSIQWAAIYAAAILTGVWGGYLSQTGTETDGFLVCALVAAGALVLVTLGVREERRTVPCRVAAVSEAPPPAGRWRAIAAVAGFLFLLNFNPFGATVLYVHLTEVLKFSEQFFGNLMSLLSIFAVIGSLAYGVYCRTVAWWKLVRLSIVMGVLSTAAYAAVDTPASAVLVFGLTGLTVITANLIQLDLAARVCPPKSAGTVFALLMGISNLGISLSGGVGGYFYEALSRRFGSDTAFQILVATGSGCTALCWLLIPLLELVAGIVDPSAENGIAGVE